MTNEAAATAETAAVAEQGVNVAPQKTSSKKDTSKKKSAPKARKAASKATPTKAKPAPAKQAKEKAQAGKKASKATTESREGSKKAIVIELLSRKEGATMAEIAKATGWRNHSIRGFISGTLGKKMGFTIESTKTQAGERTYRTK